MLNAHNALCSFPDKGVSTTSAIGFRISPNFSSSISRTDRFSFVLLTKSGNYYLRTTWPIKIHAKWHRQSSQTSASLISIDRTSVLDLIFIILFPFSLKCSSQVMSATSRWTILFLTNSEYGEANVIIAVSHELLRRGNCDVHIASYSILSKRIADLENGAFGAIPKETTIKVRL